jgi:hypothetical protein
MISSVAGRRAAAAASHVAGRAPCPASRCERAKKNSPGTCATELFSRTEILVRLAGIEPTTPWFVAKYSIQLSYSREASHYGVQPGCRSTISEET